MSLAVFLISFALLFLLGMPIAVSMLTSSLIYCVMNNINLAMMARRCSRASITLR